MVTDMVAVLTPHLVAIVHAKALTSSCLSQSNHNWLFVRAPGLQGLTSSGLGGMGVIVAGLSRGAFRDREALAAGVGVDVGWDGLSLRGAEVGM